MALLLLQAEVQRATGSKRQTAQDQRVGESAREHLATAVPRVRKRDRAGSDVPAPVVGVPAAANRPEILVGVANVEDVRPPVGEQNTRLAVRLLADQVEDVSQMGLDHLLSTELPNDRLVDRVLAEPVNPQRPRRHVDLDLPPAEEPLGEVVPEPEADTTGSTMLLEVVLGREGLDGRQIDRGDELEQVAAGRDRLGRSGTPKPREDRVKDGPTCFAEFAGDGAISEDDLQLLATWLSTLYSIQDVAAEASELICGCLTRHDGFPLVEVADSLGGADLTGLVPFQRSGQHMLASLYTIKKIACQG